MTAADFELLLVAVAGGVAVDDLKAILADRVNHRSAPAAAVAWLADTIGVDVVVAALLDGYGPDSVVASMVQVGGLERVTHEYPPELSDPCETCNGCGMVHSPIIGVTECHACETTGLDEPLYRVKEAGDRG